MIWPQRKPELTTDDRQTLRVNLPPISAVTTAEPSHTSADVTVSNIRATSTRQRSHATVNITPLPAANVIGNRAPGVAKQPSKTIVDDDFKLVSGKKRRSNGSKAVIGTRKCGNQLKVKDGRFLTAFISRLDPTVTVDDMSLYVKSVHKLEAKCVKLKTKHESYASFKVDVICNDASKFYDPDNWPSGVYLRKFFNTKN